MLSFLTAKCINSSPVLILLLLVGCNTESEPVEYMRKNIKAFNEFHDVVQKVQDAESAQENAAVVGLRGSQLVEIMRDTINVLQRHKMTRIPAIAAEELRKEREAVMIQTQIEMERIDRLRGLPAIFWSNLYKSKFNIAIAALDMIQSSGQVQIDRSLYSTICTARDLLALHGYDKVAIIRISDVGGYANEANAKIIAAANGAAVCEFPDQNKQSILVAPVEDFQAFAKKLDIGAIVCQDNSRRYLEIQADRMKLGARARTAKAEQELLAAELLKQQLISEKERKDRQDQHLAEIKKHMGLEKLDKNDPNYIEKLADNLASGDYFQRRDAIAALLKISPSDVESSEMRKKIACGFKDAAFDEDNSSGRGKAVQGLARWGGKFSVPYLLELLDQEHFLIKKDLFKALGDLQDERAAAPVAALLEDWSDHDKAKACLKRMGPVAEDAVIAVAPSPNAKVCLAAIEILTKIGSKKSVVFLRSSITKTRNPRIKVAIKSAIKIIMDRQKKLEAEK